MTRQMPEFGGGRCLCGAVRFEWNARPLWACHCHCESCRRGCSAPFTSFFGVDDRQWRWTSGDPAVYESTPGVRRFFCRGCGTQMAYAADKFPGETHFYAAAMDNPETFVAEMHVHHAEAVEWLEIRDDLPRYPGSANDGGAVRMDGSRVQVGATEAS